MILWSHVFQTCTQTKHQVEDSEDYKVRC